MVDNLAEKRKYFPGLIDSVFDLSSGGMGIHLHAVAAFASGQELTKWAKESLQTSSANYLTNPYVFSWAWREGWDPFFKKDRPYATSPHSYLHVKLLHATSDEYDRLKRVQLRLLLGGEEALSVPNPEAPIMEATEFTSLLSRAHEQGLIEGDPNTFDKVEITDNDFNLAISLMRGGFKLGDRFIPTLDEIKFSERFRTATLKAAIHKLGAMLGLTDQLTFDARALGVSIPPTYRPADSIVKWEANWQRLFNEPMPDLDGLYRQAHIVFVRYADQTDPLVAHLFALDTLPQLAA